jgi:formamidopyrimidine-DNA glycosylase
MPEIPEIEATRLVVAKELVGKKVKGIALTNGKTAGRHKTAKDFRALVEGHSIKSVSRLGRTLIMSLDNGGAWVLDPGPLGLLLKSQGAKDVKPKHTAAVMSFSAGNDWWLIDPRGEAEMFASEKPSEGASVTMNKFVDKLALSDDGKALRRAVPELASWGIDLTLDQIGWDRLGVILQVAKAPLKSVLSDSRYLCGLSSVVIDEALFVAGVRATRPSDEVSSIEVRRLHRALIEVLSEAIKFSGTTVEPENWTDPNGTKGGYQEFLAVVGRVGAPCTQCRDRVIEEVTPEWTTALCPSCQV